jgi:peptidoglycan/LPS O-acetylase OafA/YrhL
VCNFDLRRKRDIIVFDVSFNDRPASGPDAASPVARISRYVPPLWISVPVFVAAGCAYAFSLNPGHEYEMATYPALILTIGSMIAITQQTKAIGAAKLIRVLADYSFTLYLIHYTTPLWWRLRRYSLLQKAGFGIAE